MIYRPVLVTAPATTPVSLTEAKAQLDISYTDKDDLITALIAAAVSYLDGWTGILGRCLITQVWRQDFDCIDRVLRLPLFPVIGLGSVKYDDANEVEQTVSAGSYDLLADDLGFYVQFKNAYVTPVIDTNNPPSVRVAYSAGYADAASVPQAIKQAMLLLIRHWFDNPTAVNVGTIVTPMPMAVEALLAPYRRIRF